MAGVERGRIGSARPHGSGVRNLTQVSALPVGEDEDAALRACSNGLVGELFRIGAICWVSDARFRVNRSGSPGAIIIWCAAKVGRGRHLAQRRSLLLFIRV